MTAPPAPPPEDPSHADPAPGPDFVTPVDHVFVRKHLGIPRIDAAAWTLTVEGLVGRPLRLDLPAVLALPARQLTAVHECFGSPLRPDVPTRAVANIEWTGLPLSALLDRAVPLPAARHVVFEGADTGSFDGVDGLSYVKDLPLETAHRQVFLAHRMNGDPLRARHGFPLRAVVPRMFGTNSVKWLTRIVLTDERPEHMFTTTFYTRTPPGTDTPQPVREVDVNSKLLTPAPGARLPHPSVAFRGRAWSTTEVVRVDLSVDGGPWEPATLDALGADPTWQGFSLRRSLAPGPHTVRSRARDAAGRVQPPPEARNCVHEVAFTIRG
ncbi:MULTISPECIES: molybdopterin-dependent oxidoreductase [Streptomyces]|uniref:molybdopterin-dependent oxidoreductase n=1 Tax=Streptomyces TaxID=1883 RepID=UPI001E5CA9EF|nr:MULTISPECIES: molybdopterin-dependent oxidoreductase [Streptomyces]UFQ17339.1 molybdopterin-dependent oxidoreductase [Streptomyces huasconensis]WCL86945.1 molybdopterin-dependent oxidoreductase [Streptomyces sp. JCM 35825]